MWQKVGRVFEGSCVLCGGVLGPAAMIGKGRRFMDRNLKEMREMRGAGEIWELKTKNVIVTSKMEVEMKIKSPRKKVRKV